MLSVVALLILLTTCHAQQIGSIESRSFYDRDRGIKQLVYALKSFHSSFFDLKPDERDREFDRIAVVCSNVRDESTGVLVPEKETVCPAIKAIADGLEDFAKIRGILIIVDASYGKISIEGKHDITQSFVAEYNRLHL